jgi:peroxiredoxin
LKSITHGQKQCPQCEAWINSKNMKKHLEKVHGGDILKCPHCDVMVGSKNLDKHLLKVHNENVRIQNNRLSEQKGDYSYKKIFKFAAIIFVLFLLVSVPLIYFTVLKDNRSEEDSGYIVHNTVNNNKKKAPDFTVQTASGSTLSLNSLSQKVVILHFLQVLSDCHGKYFYKSDDRTPYDSSLKAYVDLDTIITINQFEQLRSIKNRYSSSSLEIISVIIPPGCCGDPLKFSQDFKDKFDITWNICSDSLQFDIWYKYTDYLPGDANRVLTRDPTVFVLDKDQNIVSVTGYIDADTLSGKIDPLL